MFKWYYYDFLISLLVSDFQIFRDQCGLSSPSLKLVLELSLLIPTHNSSFPRVIYTWEITFPALPVVLQGVLPMDIESTSAVMDSRAVEWAIILSRPWIEPCLSSRLVWNPRPPPPVPVELLSPVDFKRRISITLYRGVDSFLNLGGRGLVCQKCIGYTLPPWFE